MLKFLKLRAAPKEIILNIGLGFKGGRGQTPQHHIFNVIWDIWMENRCINENKYNLNKRFRNIPSMSGTIQNTYITHSWRIQDPAYEQSVPRA